MTGVEDPNEAQRRSWASRATGWVENERIFDAVFTPVTTAISDAAGLAAGQRVLDVGCGSGTLLAAGVAAGATVVGIDISPAMVEAARRRVPAATVLLADAQDTDVLDVAPGPAFDRVVSRFGVMFFADPGTAFRRLRAAAAPASHLVFACWRGLEENPMFTVGTEPLARRLPAAPVEPPHSPGPRSLADPARIRQVLTTGGWADIEVSPLDFTCDYGIDGSDGVEERLASILATTSGQRALAELAPTLGPAAWDAVLDEVRADLVEGLVDGVVRFPGAAWLVTAAPADS